MAGSNTQSRVRVYIKAELLFVELCNLLEKYESWSSLCATADLDAVVELCCSSPAFETNLGGLGTSAEQERPPDFIKVDCICVVGPLKLSLEDNFQRAYGPCCWSLREP